MDKKRKKSNDYFGKKKFDVNREIHFKPFDPPSLHIYTYTIEYYIYIYKRRIYVAGMVPLLSLSHRWALQMLSRVREGGRIAKLSTTSTNVTHPKEEPTPSSLFAIFHCCSVPIAPDFSILMSSSSSSPPEIPCITIIFSQIFLFQQIRPLLQQSCNFSAALTLINTAIIVIHFCFHSIPLTFLYRQFSIHIKQKKYALGFR